jgi:hypothetical protein
MSGSIINSSKKKNLYDMKKEKGSVVVHVKQYRKYNITNINNFEIINICPKDYRYVINPDWERTWTCTNGGDINIFRLEKGSTIQFESSDKKKSPSFSIGLSFKKIAEFKYSTDGTTENQSNLNIKKLDNDILVIKCKGIKSSFTKNLLNCDIEYLEIERSLEEDIVKNQEKKDREDIVKNQEKKSLFQLIKSMIFD